MEHADVASLNGKGNGELKVALGVRVGPRVEVSMKEWVSGWVAKTFDDVPSVLAKSPIGFDDK